jgi:hypothetical protein
MQSNIPEILQALFLKNLAYFKKSNPNIYNLVSNIKLDHTSIETNNEGQIELIYRGRKIYGGDAIQYTEDEVVKFSHTYQGGEARRIINIPYPGLYSIPRFFQRHLNTTIQDLYNISTNIHPEILYHDNKYDFLVMTGVGLGLQISEILDRVQVNNLLIFESDYELLTISMFFTDWESLYEKQSPKLGKSLTLISVSTENEDVEYGSLWNELIVRCPHFPFNTVFYNHGGHNKYGKFIRKIKEDQTMYMSLWGNYDDEVNQLNHIMHNIKNIHSKWIPNKQEYTWEKPVIVCGSGPSLDSRIKQLKSIANDCIVISAGTALSALLNHNIIPDFHVELESDYNVYNALKGIGKDEVLKNISLICAIQCSPYIHSLFNTTYSFVKDSLSCGDLLAKKEDKIIDATPTCVNAALSLALHYKAKDIYLFGTDFGFYDVKNHHSTKSIYNENENELDSIKEFTDSSMNNNFTKSGYLGDCLTTSVYFTTKRRVEMALKSHKQSYKFNIFNCADGLIVDETQHIKNGDTITINKNNSNIAFVNYSKSIDSDLNIKIKETMNSTIGNLCTLLIKNIEKMEPNMTSTSTTLWSISNYISAQFTKENGAMSYFIRGTLWHYMLSIYAIGYATPTIDQEKVISHWKKRFIDFLTELPDNLKSVTDKERLDPDDDQILRYTILQSPPKE